MKPVFLAASCALCALTAIASLHGLGEKTVIIGADAGWNVMESRAGVTELDSARPRPVLALASAGISAPGPGGPETDLWLSFDETPGAVFADRAGRWEVETTAAVEAVDWAHTGARAARFAGSGADLRRAAPVTARPGRYSIFAPGSRAGSFTIEFWLYPLNLENDERILTWTSSLPDDRGGRLYKSVRCEATRDRLRWDFENVFTDPGGLTTLSLSLVGGRAAPRTWSHHLIRFDAALGLIEYLVDGRLEALDYATATGREGGEVYTPVMGHDSRLILGERYSGVLDELRIYEGWVESPGLQRYATPGRVESRPLDLGRSGSRLLRIEAAAGERSLRGGVPVTIPGVAGGGLAFPGHAELGLFVRASDDPYRFGPWIPARPGEDFSTASTAAALAGLTGRFAQVAVEFYASGDGDATPYLEELRLVYAPAEPPPPPALVTAAARDGAVDLTWKPSASRDVTGYLVYYGDASSEYLAAGSPVDAGGAASLRIDGLRNGVLYYFAVAAYVTPGDPGEFSRETAARPMPSPPR